MPSAASTTYCRVRARDRVHQQRCAIGTSDRNAASGSPPASSCSAIVTNVLAAPFSNQTSPLIICCNQARRAASSGPTSSDSASRNRRLDDVDAPEVVHELRCPHQPFSLPARIGREHRGTLECGRGHHDRAAPARDLRLLLQRRRDLLVVAHRTRSAVPQPSLGVGTTAAKAAYIASRCAGGAALCTAERIRGC